MSRDKRLNRTQEVVGSIPISSTKSPSESPAATELGGGATFFIQVIEDPVC
jgi:hypothetical protein